MGARPESSVGCSGCRALVVSSVAVVLTNLHCCRTVSHVSNRVVSIDIADGQKPKVDIIWMEWDLAYEEHEKYTQNIAIQTS